MNKLDVVITLLVMVVIEPIPIRGLTENISPHGLALIAAIKIPIDNPFPYGYNYPMKRDWRVGHGKLRAGPGGLGCPCCNPYRCHPRNMKSRMKRTIRRVTKQNFREDQMNTFTCYACGEVRCDSDRGFDNLCVDCTDDRNHAFEDSRADYDVWEENQIFMENEV